VHLDEITRWNINHKYGKCYGSVLAVLPCHWPVVQIDSTGKKIGLYHLWKMGSGTLLNKAWNLGTAMYSNNKLNHSWSVKPLRRLHKHALTGISITEFYSYFPPMVYVDLHILFISDSTHDCIHVLPTSLPRLAQSRRKQTPVQAGLLSAVCTFWVGR
jgi:hypothetical protein